MLRMVARMRMTMMLVVGMVARLTMMRMVARMMMGKVARMKKRMIMAHCYEAN